MKMPKKDRKLEVSASVIIHATEDDAKIQDAMCDSLYIDRDSLAATKTTGHFENPILILDTTVTGHNARLLVGGLRDALSDAQALQLAEQIEERTLDSRLYIRLDKQALVRDRRIEILGLCDDAEGGRDMIKLKIHTPIYNKRETRQIFKEVMGLQK